MVDAAVTLVAVKLGSFLVQQASLLGGVHDDFEEIKREFESMRSFLKDADRRKESNEGVKIWVGQVRDVAYEVEDLIDEFEFRMDKRGGFRGLLHNSLRRPKSIVVVHQMASQLQKVKSKVVGISERRNRYGLDRIEEGAKADETWQRYGESSLFREEDDIVGIKKSQDLLVGWLTDDEPRRRVISVLGMGGMGKTTLAAKAYNSQVVKSHFHCHARITVSQSYRIEEVLRSLVREFFERKEMVPDNLSIMNYGQLITTLNDYLKQKRYMVVLDDVWSINALEEIIIAFPENICGSRVLLTARNEDVAYSSGPENHVYYLEPLDEAAAWALFCKKAFCNDRERCPPELEPFARTIVQKCEGLPLAIVAIGGLMSLKDKKKREWKEAVDSLSWELSNNPRLERVKNILLLSYHDLPYHLKHCFLYCSVFPEDYLIKRKMLIRLWVAEGLVEKRRDLTMENVAERYLQELVCRSMIQVARTNDFGRVKACRMHDLVRDLALSISEKENFCAVCDRTERMQDGKKARRLSIHKSSKYIPTDMNMTYLRSFFVFVTDVIPSSSLNQISSSFRLLRVLDLQGASIEILPDELFDLFNLRYLNLRKNKIRELPKTLKRLQNLQILDIRENNIERLTSKIVKLQKLRHLFVRGRDAQRFGSFNFVGGLQVPKGIWKLINLQSLSCIEANREVVRQVGNLNQLRKLGIAKVRGEDGPELCASIEKMDCLVNLYLTATGEEEFLRLQALSRPPPLLQKLTLVGRLERLPTWIGNRCNLTHLSLHCSRLRVDPLHSLRGMSNLVRLSLSKAYDGQCLWIRAGWFEKLKILELSELIQLNFIGIEKTAIPSIQSLALICCRELKELPQGIEYLTGLQQLYLQNMPKELVESLRIQESKYIRQRAQHIPDIKHVFQVGQKWFSESLT
ncbi:disease resistance protein RPM1-like [Magnolia sinica]|uniref:disease resistance protein RPM1-like n=1 Tax=Magnolia sinica TaxID=86752 RepID=UPI00265947FD|nr:disease resistance protein RPM1-like [Magnolia sinica]